MVQLCDKCLDLYINHRKKLCFEINIIILIYQLKKEIKKLPKTPQKHPNQPNKQTNKVGRKIIRKCQNTSYTIVVLITLKVLAENKIKFLFYVKILKPDISSQPGNSLVAWSFILIYYEAIKIKHKNTTYSHQSFISFIY